MEKVTYVIDILKASRAFVYFLFNGQPIVEYSVSIGILVFSATCRNIEATIFALLYLSSHRIISSATVFVSDKEAYMGGRLNVRETRRFDRSI